MKELTEEKLLGVSAAFDALAKTFVREGERKDRGEIARLVDTIAGKACQDCGLAHFCWEEDLYKTYGMTFAALSHCDSLGRFRASDLPQEFADTCPRVDTLVDTINEVYGLYRRDCLWTSRLRECRELVGQQLLAVGEIMESLSGQMELNCIFLEGAEKELRLRVMQCYAWQEEIPVIVISAAEDTRSVERAYDMGVADYIRRPFERVMVLRRVTRDHICTACCMTHR